MKLLHTGDWHVGKGLPGRSRTTEHEAVLAEIVDIARAERVDLILVAGDIFDSTSPLPEAENIVYSALLELSNQARVVVVPGNHDNERRLGAIASLLELANVTVRPFVAAGEGKPLIVETPSGDTARVALLPWLSQRYLVKAQELMLKQAADLTGQFNSRMRDIISHITKDFDESCVNVLLGHVTIAGGELGGGERTAQTIFDYWVDPTAFPSSAHYVALGHLHKMQAMAGPCPIYYCGSPLQLDFSDKNDANYVLIVEAGPGTPAEVTARALTSGTKLRTISGTLEQLQALVDTTGDDFLRVFVKEPARSGLGNEVRELFRNVIKVIVDPPELSGGAQVPPTDRTVASPHDLFVDYLGEKKIEDPRMVALFDELYEECS